LPGPIDTDSTELQNVLNLLNKTAAELQGLVTGQLNDNIFKQAQEVQFHVVIVCVFVCLFVCFVFLF
jgi:hypothetical protein